MAVQADNILSDRDRDDRTLTSTAVNPKLIISIGVSGAPQHVDYIGDRATIIAFNKDADAPLMTLNKRRARPKVAPIVGDLFETVPRFTAALKA